MGQTPNTGALQTVNQFRPSIWIIAVRPGENLGIPQKDSGEFIQSYLQGIEA